MKVEPLDDLGLLAAQFEKVNLSDLFDAHFPDHGNWGGISGGQTICGWLLYILNECDHRLSHVEEWSGLRLTILSLLLGVEECKASHFSDDRLASLLDRLSDDDKWKDFEIALGKSTLEVFVFPDQSKDVDVQVIRADSFNAPQFRKPGGIFQFGYTKHRRKDQTQCKVMTATIDPFATPLAVEVVAGNGPDYDHYLPVIERVQQQMLGSGHLFVGDSQLGSISNRQAIHLSGDYYLCPLNRKQYSEERMREDLDRVDRPLEELPHLLSKAPAKGPSVYFYEVSHLVETQEDCRWDERLILNYSVSYGKQLNASLDDRLQLAEQALQALVVSKRGRRNPKTMPALHARIAQLLKKHQVQNCFITQASQTVEQKVIQKHKGRPQRTEQITTLHLKIERDEEYIARKRRLLGWRAYATNTPKDRMNAKDLVQNYRNEYRIEHLFDYAINRDVGLLPLYLKKENRIKGLIRLLMVGMRFSCSIQAKARHTLRLDEDELSGIYPGNPGRKTDKPTTSMMLRAMKGVSVVFMPTGSATTTVHMTPLSGIQLKVLKILGLDSAYDHLIRLLETRLKMPET